MDLSNRPVVTTNDAWGLFRAQMDLRLSRLTPDHTIKGLFLKGYLDLFRREGGEELHQRCLKELGDKRVVDVFNYPYSGVMRIGLLAAEPLAPKLGGIENYLREMGRLATQGYLDSVLGRAYRTLVNPTPHSMLSMMPTAIRTCFSFGERKVRFPSPTEAVFECRDDFSPAEANAGGIEAAITATRGRDIKVEVKARDLFNYDIHAHWTA